jgi:hypothetical protein
MEFTEDDVKHVVNKSEQALRIIGSLWDRRIAHLEIYYHKKYSTKSLLLKSKIRTDDEMQEDFSILKKQLFSINRSENKTVEIVDANIDLAINVLETSTSECVRETKIFETQIKMSIDGARNYEKINLFLLSNLKRYKNLIFLQKEILAEEKILLDNPLDSSWKLYLSKLRFFSNEIDNVRNGYANLKQYKQELSVLQEQVTGLQALSLKKSSVNYVAPSSISAFFRVGISLTVSGAIMGNSFANPYFWKLNSIIFMSVLIINFMDYYFNIFSNLTNRIVNLSMLKQLGH